MVFFKKRLDRLVVCTRKVLKEPFQPPWRHAPQQHARLWANVLKGMHRIFRDEDERSGGCTLDTIVELEVKFPAQDVEEFILRSVDVHRRSASRDTCVTPHPPHAPRLRVCREDLETVRLSPERP
jgi:hypothetical protein